jgi:hypothetical protein
MSGDFRRDRGDYARVLFHFAREAAGASGARHSLRPLMFRGQEVQENSREQAARSRSYVCCCMKFESVGWAKARLRRAHHVFRKLKWWARLRFAHPTRSAV